jgi:hypothetical protein
MESVSLDFRDLFLYRIRKCLHVYVCCVMIVSSLKCYTCGAQFLGIQLVELV